MTEPGTDQHQSGVAVWEGSNHPRPAPDLPVHPFDHIVGLDLRPVLRGKVAVSTPKIEMMNPEFSPAAIVGSIPCSTPDEREAQVKEYLSLSVSFFGKGNFYALRASGNSMVDAQIDDGDLVIIREQQTAEVGDIVVALTDEEKNTLKRLCFDSEHQSYYLHPENKEMEDIYVSNLRVQGIATHVIKTL